MNAHSDVNDQTAPSTSVFFDSCLGVFQGGGCRAIAYVGAVKASEDFGVHFAEVAGASAGAIVAGLLAAGANAGDLATAMASRPFDAASEPATPMSQGVFGGLVAAAGRRTRGRVREAADAVMASGAHSTARLEEWMEGQLRTLLQLDRTVHFEDLLLPCWIVATDLDERKPVVWSQSRSPDYGVAHAVAASAALPGYFQPVDNRYVDGGAMSNLPSFVYQDEAQRRVSRRVLAYVLTPPAVAPTAKVPVGPIARTKGFANSLVETLVSGAQSVQLNLQPNVSIISIPDLGVRATDFKKLDGPRAAELTTSGFDAARRFFQRELTELREPASEIARTYSRHETWAETVRILRSDVAKVTVIESSTVWLYELFPVILNLRHAHIPISVVCAPPTTEGGNYRQALLRSLGVSITNVTEDLRPITFVDGMAKAQTTAIMRPAETGVDALILSSAAGLGYAIEAMKEKCRPHLDESPQDFQPPTVEHSDPEPLLAALREVPQYSGPDIHLEIAEIALSSVVPLARTVPEFKYRQVSIWDQFYGNDRAHMYSPIKVIMTADGPKESMVTPPVLEKSGDDFVLIQGAARVLYLRAQDVLRMSCVVVSGVRDPLPASPSKLARLRNVMAAGGPTDRYARFDYQRFRSIEAPVHTAQRLGRTEHNGE